MNTSLIALAKRATLFTDIADGIVSVEMKSVGTEDLGIRNAVIADSGTTPVVKGSAMIG